MDVDAHARTFVWYCPKCLSWQLDCHWRLLDTTWAAEDIQWMLGEHWKTCAPEVWGFTSVDGLNA